MGYYGFPEYVSVAEKKRKAEAAVEKMRKKDPSISPVIIEGTKLIKTWWGKAWVDNLKKYSDYENRIGRGRSYVKNRAVLDLKMEKGVIKALVQGSGSKPYNVEIIIKELEKPIWESIKKSAEGKIESLQELMVGKFPKALTELFTEKGHGLFPSQKEITMRCSCPDGAAMCKHLAAVFYGVGARLDENPSKFFELRNVKVDELISEAIKGKAESMISKSSRRSRRVLDDADVGNVFGVEIETEGKTKARTRIGTDEVDSPSAKSKVKIEAVVPKRRGIPKKS